MADDVHGKPAEGMECLAMFEPIDETNYVEYQAAPTGKWRPCLYGAEMIEGLRTSQYKNYMERIQKSDCKAEMRFSSFRSRNLPRLNFFSFFSVALSNSSNSEHIAFPRAPPLVIRKVSSSDMI